MIVPLMTAEIFDLHHLDRLLGVILTADGVAEAISPWIVSHTRDVTGTCSGGFLALIALALLGAVATTAMPKRVARA